MRIQGKHLETCILIIIVVVIIIIIVVVVVVVDQCGLYDQEQSVEEGEGEGEKAESWEPFLSGQGPGGRAEL